MKRSIYFAFHNHISDENRFPLPTVWLTWREIFPKEEREYTRRYFNIFVIGVTWWSFDFYVGFLKAISEDGEAIIKEFSSTDNRHMLWGK